MRNRVIPAALSAIAVVALGCTGTPTSSPSPDMQPEGRVNVGGANVTNGDVNSAAAVAARASGSAAVSGTLPAANQPGSGSAPAQAGTTTNAQTSTTTTTTAANPPVVSGGTVVAPAANSTDRVGTTVMLAPGEALPAPGNNRLTDPSSPSPSPSPTPTPTPDPNVSTGVTVPAASPSALAALSFSEVRTFSPTASIQIINFSTIVVADGTSLYVSTDEGATWTVYQNVGRQTIRCMSFTDQNTGWVAGDAGTLLQISISSGTLSYKVMNSGTASPIDAIYFSAVTPLVGYYADENAGVLRKTTDGGVTWGLAIAASTTVLVNRTSGFRPDGANGALYMPYDPILAPGQYTNVYQVQGGTNFVQLSPNKNPTFGGLTQFAPLVLWHDNTQPAPQFVTTVDWKTFGTFSADMLTPTQILRGALAAVYPIDVNTLLGQTKDGQLALSKDLGHSWTDPIQPNHAMTWLWPTSQTQVWGYDRTRGTLLRAGT